MIPELNPLLEKSLIVCYHLHGRNLGDSVIFSALVLFGDLPRLNSDFSSLSKASWTNNNEIISKEPRWIFPERFATNINQLEISKAGEFLLRTCPFTSVYFTICLVYMGYFHWHHRHGSPRELFPSDGGFLTSFLLLVGFSVSFFMYNIHLVGL